VLRRIDADLSAGGGGADALLDEVEGGGTAAVVAQRRRSGSSRLHAVRPLAPVQAAIGIRREIVLGGVDPISGAREADTFVGSERDSEDRIVYAALPVDLSNDCVHLTGSAAAKQLAAQRLEDRRGNVRPGNPSSRAPLGALRDVIIDRGTPDVGGEIQVGCTAGNRFARVGTVTPVAPGEPQARMTMNNIDWPSYRQLAPALSRLTA
jgi:hypothetical protein